MRSLADQIREHLDNPTVTPAESKKTKPEKKKKTKENPAIIEAMTAFDTSENKSMVHARFDEKTVRLMNYFKMATGIEVTRLVSFAVKQLFDTYPELKTTIKHFIQNNEL